MKYLKKFATAEEYNAFVESGQMERPNVSLVEVPFTTYYNKYIPFGTHIQHIDGGFYTAEDWTSKGFTKEEANGISIVTQEHSYIIKRLGRTYYFDISTELYNCTTTTDKNEAQQDFNGESNTKNAIQENDLFKACAEYLFPRGETGYFPAAGEISILLQFIEDYNMCASAIGVPEIDNTDNIWTSTQYDESNMWIFTGTGTISKRKKYVLSGVDPLYFVFAHLTL